MKLAYSIYNQPEKPKQKKASKKQQIMNEVLLMISEQKNRDRMDAVRFFNKLRNTKKSQSC